MSETVCPNPKSRISPIHVVVIDDEPEMRSLLRDYLEREGCKVSEYPSATAALKALAGPTPMPADLVITDIKMPGMTGLEFIDRVKAEHPRLPVVLITAFGSLESAIAATRKGAFDYIVKPFQLTEIRATVERVARFTHLNRENAALREHIRINHNSHGIIGKSPEMQKIFDLIRRVSQATANVLIVGESGTGKERVARALHDLSPRASKPFIAINCTAIPEALMESELFGHAKGSFTGAIQSKKGLFEEANSGTVFLDEVGDMSLALQSKLLRVIQERKIRAVGESRDRDIDIRLIAATHKDLKLAIRQGSFREDLFYRLNVIPITIPPLRERREDIPLLAEHFLQKYCAINGVGLKTLSSAAMTRLMDCDWPGNVRELENVIERAVVLCGEASIQDSDLPNPERLELQDFFSSAKSSYPTLEELEKKYIQFVLEETAGRKEKASQVLGINRRTLYRKEREYRLPTDGNETD